MKIIKTALGWEIQPENNDEETRLYWLIDCLKAFGAFTAVDRSSENIREPFSADTLFDCGEVLILDVIARNSQEVKRSLGL